MNQYILKPVIDLGIMLSLSGVKIDWHPICLQFFLQPL